MKRIAEIADVLRKARTVAVAGHINPDGDAVGACFALAFALSKLRKHPVVLLDDYNVKFNVIPGREFLTGADFSADAVFDVFVALDCADASRLSEQARTALSRAKDSVCVDHHAKGAIFAVHNFIESDASSASELVYYVIDSITDIDKNIAAALYAGILFDSGGFRHPTTSPETFTIASRLVATGIPFSEITREMMFAHSPSESKLLARAIDSLIIDDAVAKLFITRDDLKECSGEPKDLDGIVEYALNTRGVEAAVFLYETADDGVKASFRSKGADVGKVARFFGGGGHAPAAGCSIKATVKEAFEMIEPVLRTELYDRRN